MIVKYKDEIKYTIIFVLTFSIGSFLYVQSQFLLLLIVFGGAAGIVGLRWNKKEIVNYLVPYLGFCVSLLVNYLIF